MKVSKHANLYFTFIEVAQRIEANIKQALKPFELTHGQFNILRILRGSKGIPLNAKNIKERMIVSNPDVTRLIDRLVKKGLVSREVNPNNRRQVEILLTDKGSEILKKVDPVMLEAACYFFKDIINDDEVVVTSSALAKINQYLIP